MREFCLIGKKLGHSMSPDIHKKLFEFSDKEGNYSLVEIPEEDFEKDTDRLKEYSGYNITIPYKVKIIPYLNEISEGAKRYGAVNCVDNKDGKAKGYNTDVDGFLKSLSHNNIPLNKKVLLLGCGGAGRMMAYETLLCGGKLTVAVRSGSKEKTEKILSEIKGISPFSEINVIEYKDISGNFDTLINSTPVGMYPDVSSCPVCDDVIKSCDHVFDAIYNPCETVLIKKSKAMGKNAVGGMAMLVYQAVSAHEIWDNAVYQKDAINALIREMEEQVKRKFV